MSYVSMTDIGEARAALNDLGGWLLDLGSRCYVITDDAGIVLDLRGEEFLKRCEATQCWDETTLLKATTPTGTNYTPQTYTIAYTIPTNGGSPLLLATVPDGQNIDAAAYAELAAAGARKKIAYAVIPGLTLTNVEPMDYAAVKWRCQEYGMLTNENGETFQYAVRLPDGG